MDSAYRSVIDELPDTEAVARLYNSVGWSSYTRDIRTLMRGLGSSAYLNCVYHDSRLIALVRCISDGATIAYLQDLLVDPAYQRKGIGKHLCRASLARFEDCRQFVLVTDDRPEQTAFYESLALVRLDKASSVRLHAFARMPGLE